MNVRRSHDEAQGSSVIGARSQGAGWEGGKMGAEMIEQPPITVLLVEPEKELRERLGSWLEGDGFEVMVCPGPGRPDYTCVGTSRGACPLLDAASIVVMDLALPGDDVMRGTSRWDLLSSYVGADRPVVAIARQGETF